MEETILQTAKEFLAALGLAVEKIAFVGGKRPAVAVTTSGGEDFTAAGDEVLRALNTVFHRLVEKACRVPHTDVRIDINGFYQKKDEALQAEAQMAAQKVRLFKKEIPLSPMNPYQRLVVHELFAEDADIKTISTGEGAERHIVLAHR